MTEIVNENFSENSPEPVTVNIFDDLKNKVFLEAEIILKSAIDAIVETDKVSENTGAFNDNDKKKQGEQKLDFASKLFINKGYDILAQNLKIPIYINEPVKLYIIPFCIKLIHSYLKNKAAV